MVHRRFAGVAGACQADVNLIARSLVVQRPLVVLDEPTSQQDEAHAELVTTVLVAAARAGTAIVCATHDPVLAAAADETIELA